MELGLDTPLTKTARCGQPLIPPASKQRQSSNQHVGFRTRRSKHSPQTLRTGQDPVCCVLL